MLDDKEPQSVIHCEWLDPIDKTNFKCFQVEWCDSQNTLRKHIHLRENQHTIEGLRSGTLYFIQVKVIKLDGKKTSACTCEKKTNSGNALHLGMQAT